MKKPGRYMRTGMEVSENAKAAEAAFDTADDAFTTCQMCGRKVAARKEGGEWRVAEHECDAKST